MYYLYIIKSIFRNKFYTGCTQNIENRLNEHNQGKCYWTKRYKPWIIHYIEKFESRQKAFSREKYLKSHAGRNWIKKNINTPG